MSPPAATPEPIELWFDLQATARLAEHVAASTTHYPNGEEQLNHESCPGALVWAADRGTYLSSNGFPPLLANPADPDSTFVLVYACGWGPDSDRRLLGASAVGQDDFGVHLHLSTGPDPWLLHIRQAVKDGKQWMVLLVEEQDVGVRFTSDNPPAQQPGQRDVT